MNLMKVLGLALLTTVLLSNCKGTDKKERVSSKEESKEAQIEKPTESGVKEVLFNMESYFQAALDGDINLIKDAVSSGVDVNAINEQGQSALMLTSFNGHLPVIKFLIDNGANVTIKDENSRNALMYASTGPFNESVKYLLASGAKADINAIDNVENWTAVMFASGEGQVSVMKTLIEAGADIKMVDIDGESSYDFAVANKHPEAAEYLKSLE